MDLDKLVPLEAGQPGDEGGGGHHGGDDLPCDLLRLGAVGLRDAVVARPAATPPRFGGFAHMCSGLQQCIACSGLQGFSSLVGPGGWAVSPS